MKKIIVLVMATAVLTIFNGCQKEELRVSQLANEVQPQEVVKPDVYLEEDYLAFKDYNTYDSIASLLNAESINLIEEFEKNLGFTSAFSFRKDASNKLDMADEKGERILIQELSEKGYFDEKNKTLKYPFHNETRAVVLNPEGKVKIGKVIYRFVGMTENITISEDHNGLMNVSKTINLDDRMLSLKSATVLYDSLVASGQQRLTLKIVREDEAAYDYIIVDGQVVWGIVGYHWTVNMRFHSYRQRLLSSPDRETYFHWIAYHFNIGGNGNFWHYQYNPSNPYTGTSPWTALYYLEIYDSGLVPDTTPPTIWQFNMDCWSERIPDKITNVDYSD